MAQIIEEGRVRDVLSHEIAGEILALAVDPAWTKPMGHPMRAAIMQLLHDEGPQSPSRVADRLGGSVGLVAYHFRTLQRLGQIELDRHIPRRGSTEHIYRVPGSLAPRRHSRPRRAS